MRVDCDGFEVETLINIRVAKAGLRVDRGAELRAQPRCTASSNLRTFRDGWRVLRTIFRERSPFVVDADEPAVVTAFTGD